ncbi:MAG: tetratricopeptide repeat protein [Nitrospiraceae bacterium]|nr:MAG: tetratricopeptide repeat protein [Nitrospiraceae bacterium]
MVILAITGLITLAACTGHQAEELFKTAEFEELQNNREHARQLYEEIIQKYPESDYARKADARLSELKQAEGSN